MSEHRVFAPIHNSGYGAQADKEPVRQGQPEQQRADPRAYQEGGVHYTGMQVQPWDVIDTWPSEQRVGFYRGNALKYLMRMGTKDAAVQEAKKARHYANKLVDTLTAKKE